MHLDTAVLFVAFRDSATVEERRRLAREMHDGVAQEMASLGYFVDSMVDQDPEGSDDARQLQMLRERLTMVVGEVRRSVRTLRTSVGENDTLGTAIGSLARHLSASSGSRSTSRSTSRPPRLRPDVEAELLRIAQEAMNNAVRHAGTRSSTSSAASRRRSRRSPWRTTAEGSGSAARTSRTGSRSWASGPPLVEADLHVTDGVPHGRRRRSLSAPLGVSCPCRCPYQDTLIA